MTLFNSLANGCLCATNYRWRIIISPPIGLWLRAFSSPLLSIYPGLWLSWLSSLPASLSLWFNSRPPTCPTQCFSIRWLMHTHCGLRSSWNSGRLCQTNHSGKFWEGGLSHLTQIKPGRKACLLLVIPHLLDKASQGSSALLNWCTYPYLYWSSLWLGERGESDRTGSYSSPHAYLLILIHGRIGFFRSHFSSYAWHGIFIEPATTNAAVWGTYCREPVYVFTKMGLYKATLTCML